MRKLVKKLISAKNRRRILRFLNRAWIYLCGKLPLRDRALFFTVRANGKPLENLKAVFDALDAKKVVFARKLPHSIKVKPLAYYYLLTSRVIVTDDYVRYLRAVKLRKGQKILQLWHACGAFKKFGLDAPSRLTEKEERATHSQYTAVAVTSEGCRKFYAGAFGVSEDVCLPIGLPRTDSLMRDAERIREELLERRPEARGKRLYLYCPTFRESGGKKRIYDPKINWRDLSEKLEEDEIFIIKRHPIMQYGLIKEEFDNVKDAGDESTVALTAACDVLITDYSSVVYDACLLNVPVVFYCPDLKEFERGFYINFPDDLPGELVEDPEKLLDAIRNAKENPPLEKMEKFREEQTSACDGKATERAVALIKSWLK